ncbi:MAG: MGMT family protein [Actinomycetota bacterium]
MSADGEIGLTVFDTTLGGVGIAWRSRAADDPIIAMQLPEGDRGRTRHRLVAKAGRVSGGPVDAVDDHPPPAVAAAIGAIGDLLAGGSRDLLDIEIDLAACSPFERQVYEVTRSILPGTTLTYGQVAERVGQPGAAQAVGRSLGANPIPIVVPCHRVLGADGALTGFSAAGGVDTKRRMLLIEGCPQVAPTLFDDL